LFLRNTAIPAVVIISFDTPKLLFSTDTFRMRCHYPKIRSYIHITVTFDARGFNITSNYFFGLCPSREFIETAIFGELGNLTVSITSDNG
jgi:hypothetical protein